MGFKVSTDCYKRMNVSKYHHRNMICYKIIPTFVTPGYTLDIIDYQFESEGFGVIYYYVFDKKLLSRVKHFSIYVHEPDTSDIIDAYVAKYQTIDNPQFTVSVTYESLYLKFLEPPYDTKCKVYPSKTTQTDVVLMSIQNDTLSILNKSIPGLMISEPLNSTVIQSSQLQNNETLRNIYGRIVKYHKNRLPGTCDIKTVIPKVTLIPFRSFVISVTWPDGFHIENSAVPKLVLMEYIIYISSCIGLWFGLSAFDFIMKINRLDENKEADVRMRRMMRIEIEKFVPYRQRYRMRI